MTGKEINVAFIGNPNCGKTTLFNAYTGAKLKVANWPGVTVEKKEGAFKYHDNSYRLVDLPGIYSLTSYTMEEKVSRKYILGTEVDVIVDVIDASSLERNLYLALQLIELGKPVILALNMMDIVEERGMEIDIHRMQEMLGVPIIPVSARKRTGLDILMHAVSHHKNNERHRLQHHHERGNHSHDHHSEQAVVYSDDIEDKIDFIESMLGEKYKDLDNLRLYAIKHLENDVEVQNDYPLDLNGLANEETQTAITRQKYDFIEEVIEECLMNKNAKSEFTDKIDAVLTHRIWGVPIFFGIMALVFMLTFTLGDWLKIYFEYAITLVSDGIQSGMTAMNVSPMLTSLVVDGVVAGIGGVLTFLPNIIILFFALAILEDSGYMSRVAYVMDGIMSSLGLSGRAFIPMLLGFGCTVPAVMASRTLEDKRDRLRTILAIPFMSCSAKLPIYVLLSGLFFGKYAPIAAYSMYIIGVLAAILALKISSKVSRDKDVRTLLIELPEYKKPNARTVFIYVWDKVKDYLTKAGTTIFIASVVLWVLLNFNMNGMTDDISSSFAASFGKVIEPVMSPAGLGCWQIIVSLIAGIAGKEVVVSSMGVLFGIANVSSQSGMAVLATDLSAMGFTAINAYSMMLFCLLYVPCVAAVGTIKRETKSWKWTLGSICIQLCTAWIVSTLFYQIATLIVG